MRPRCYSGDLDLPARHRQGEAHELPVSLLLLLVPEIIGKIGKMFFKVGVFLRVVRDLQAGRVISSCRHPGHVDLRAGQVVVVLEDGELLGVPERHRAGHVDAEGLVSLLEAAHREELERVDVVAKVQPTLLSHLQD